MANTTWPDGEPRRGPNDTGSVGGLKDGRALRHADGTEPNQQNFGWLDGVKGVIGGPNRAANGPGVNIGPSSPHWRKPAGPYTVGDQKKPRRGR
jgi:hypothetical protein